MKVLQINTVYKIGSTGVIMRDISNTLQNNGEESFCAFASGNSASAYEYPIETSFQQKFSVLQTRVFGKHGFYNKSETKKLVSWIRSVSPDIIHLHNIHGHYLNMEILFSFLKEYGKPVVWTLHDCWPFTGHCAHFESYGCEKWKTGCFDCPQLKSYPQSLIFDRSRTSWLEKKALINSIDSLTFCATSNWVANIAAQSFAGNKEIRVIHNGVDTSVFCPREIPEDIKDKISGKFVILGMANKWLLAENRESVDYLVSNLPEDAVILLVGCRPDFVNPYPERIVTLPYVRNPELLASYYSAADVFVNMTLEDTFPTVNMEALSCGTPVITNISGGSAEVIDSAVGFSVPKRNKEALVNAVIQIYNGTLGKDVSENCRKKIIENFDKNAAYDKYLELYCEKYAEQEGE